MRILKKLNSRTGSCSGSCRSQILWVTFTLLCASDAGELDIDKASSKIRRFCSDVIYSVGVGDTRRLSFRMPEKIGVKIVSDQGFEGGIRKHLDKFCVTTGVTIIDKAGDGDTILSVYHLPKEKLVDIAKELSREITIDRGFSYWVWWEDGDRSVSKAVIFLASDSLAGKNLEDKLIEQLLGVFGLPSLSDEFDESCMAMNETLLVELQPIDLRLLEFFYKNIPAGTRPREFDAIFREKWAN